MNLRKRSIMPRFIKLIYTIAIIMLFTVLTGCDTTDDVSVSEVLQTPVETVVSDEVSISEALQIPTEIVLSEKPKNLENPAPKPSSFDTYEDYITYITSIPRFEPYYKTVFAFESLAGGVSSVPLNDVKAMYNELKTFSDYVVVSEYPLYYRGYYEGDTIFVDGYEQYQTADVGRRGPNPINVVGRDWDGNKIMITPLKTVLLCENTFSRFDNSIEEGRNLQASDFTLAAPDKPISVVLGNAYKGIYEISDILSLQLISEVMNFQVVGFYKSDVGFSMDAGALHNVSLDYTIVMPHFIPDYEPIGKTAIFQHAFHLAELTSGYIAITEPITELNEDTHARYVAIVEEMAQRNNLSGLYKSPYWPVGFVW